MTDANERTLLLHDDEAETPRQEWKAIFGLALLIMVTDLSSYVAEAGPEQAIVERIICNKYQFAMHYSEDEKCKIEPIQSQVALLLGWKDALIILPSVLTTLPYGLYADRLGRKKVLLLSLLGMFLSDCWVRLIYWFPDVLPVELVLASGVWCLIGGGSTTFTTMLFVTVGDLSHPSERALTFSMIQAATMLSEFLAIFISVPLMRIDPWTPFWASTVLTMTGFIFAVLLVPETLQKPDSNLNWREIRSQMRDHVAKIREFVSWLRLNIGVLLVVSAFFVWAMGRRVMAILILFASKKFHVPIDKAAYIISLRSAVSLVSMVVMIPVLSHLFERRLRMRLAVKDKRITLITGLFLILGCTVTFFAPTFRVMALGQALFALGHGFSTTARSLVTFLVDAKHRTLLYTVLSLFAYTGALIGGPALAQTFSWGMQLGDFWIGLPFLVAGVSFALASMAILFTQTQHHFELI